ncbi:MAG: S41 family peptidase [Tychonema bourrellyi B0820]|uniref:Carboxyl-terminal-processing protease n=1 Tax=Tychonema bourrellyi FEM_GT703 TaxID=2040638 RepID=A0A2G4EVR1_9CYAN|nr:carboxyl-terminal processing protease CtpA [Tychonema bourrellyi]MDQ2098999.1 S41 family peptidase [Tychonema bourrellyi B0820]PHX53530.1 carboxyl-terminal protease [Tychonema bourrellyi FEM_GT703]
MHRRVFQMAILFVLQVALVFGSWAQPAMALTDEQKLLNEAWRIVNRSYVDDTFNHKNWRSIREKVVKAPLNDRPQTYTAIQEMLANLDDPFTRLLKPEQYRSLQVNTSGELTGVGLQIAIDPQTNTLTVIAPITGSPADRAGIQPLDRILKIDGTPTSELSLDEAATKMRGRVGTPITLTLGRAGRDSPEDIQLVRARISLNPVYAELQSGPENSPLGYIRLSQFSANATAEVAHAIDRLEKQGAAAYILDLRNNPGGLLQAGIEIARLWIDSGTIVYTVNRQGILGSFEASGQALTGDPLIVLVNKGTASASEILAGALQDNGRAQLVGEKTFGKGLIQSLFDLSDGSGLAVTVAKYETPNHTDINKLGIAPDRVVPLESITRDQIGTEADLQYQAALQLLKQKTIMASGMGQGA